MTYSDYLYGPHPSQFVRVWRPPTTNPTLSLQLTPVPVVFLLHGGFWKAKYGIATAAGTACETIAPDLVTRGFAAVEIEYRCGDGFPFPCPNQDVVEAVRFVNRRLKSAFGLQIERSAILGFSAGGQLALWAAMELEPALRPRVVIGVAPVADLELAVSLRLSDEGDAVERYVGGTPAEIPELFKQACPTQRASELIRLPFPIVICTGEQDTDVPQQVVSSFRNAVSREAQLLQGQGQEQEQGQGPGPGQGAQADEDGLLNVSFVQIPGADHYALMDATSPAWGSILNFVNKHLQN